MRYLSLCSGIEAASVAWGQIGWTPAGFAEIEPFPCAVLKHHYPEVPNLGDITASDFTERARGLGKIDVLIGGTPCQAFSVAGLRNSLGDARGNLTLRFVEIVHAVRADVVVWENVPGVLKTKDNAFGCFLAGLVGADAPLVPAGKPGRWTDAGLVVGPQGTAAWRVLDAQYFGLAQRRRRVFVVYCPPNGASLAEILFEPEGLQRYSDPRPKTRQGPATHAPASVAIRGYGSGRIPELGEPDVAYTVDTAATQGVAAIGFNHQENQNFRAEEETCNPLRVGQTEAVCIGLSTAVTPKFAEELSPTLTQPSPSGGGQAGGGAESIYSCRRLTVVECSRLQGFPDHYLDITYRGKPAADGPRYKSLGNSMATPVVRWIGQRIALVDAWQPGLFAYPAEKACVSPADFVALSL